MYKKDNDSLMSKWQGKESHQGKHFIKDGIVNYEQWVKQDKKILFVLKEAYGSYDDLCDRLFDEGDHGHAMWNRVSEWANGLLGTTSTSICRYAPLDKQDVKELLNKIAIMNIKKSGGKEKSNDGNLREYAKADATELKEQFKLISPDIVVCGYTFGCLKLALGVPLDCDQSYCFYDNKLLIDYYHPAGRTVGGLLMYYGLCAIYQQALLEQEGREHHANE